VALLVDMSNLILNTLLAFLWSVFLHPMSVCAAKRMLQRPDIHVEWQNYKVKNADCKLWWQIQKNCYETNILTSWMPEQIEGTRDRESTLKRDCYRYLIVLLIELNCGHLSYILKLVPYYCY
jgi:hypothetical protein